MILINSSPSGSAALRLPVLRYRMTAIRGEGFRNLRQRENEIDGAGHDGAAWHPVVVGLFRILCDNQAAHLLDRLCPNATIGAGSREDDADGALTELLGERVQQEVERQSHALASPGMGKLKCAVAYREIASGRDDVDVVRLRAACRRELRAPSWRYAATVARPSCSHGWGRDAGPE